MMKFFRKYNKYLLAISASGLLVFWLGGDALQNAFRPDDSKQVVATADGGSITRGDQQRVEVISQLQRFVGLNWAAWSDPNAPNDEKLSSIDWILLQREAKRFGSVVRRLEAKRLLANSGIPESAVGRVAIQRDITPERIYDAAADYYSVQKMMQLFQASAAVPEAQLRVLARDLYEQASIEVVALPAESFIDPDETFRQEELQAQFEKHKDQHVASGLSFGYYLEPRVKIQYIEINPAAMQDQLGDDRLAYQTKALRYWKVNRRNPEFRKPADVIAAERMALADMTTIGVSQAAVSEYYESFAEARPAAIDSVKARDAKAEADRIIGRLKVLLAEPWFDIIAERTEYKPAPEDVARMTYYEELLADLPGKARYSDGVNIGLIDWVTEAELARTRGIGATYHAVGPTNSLPFGRLAFIVEGLAEIPENLADRSLYLSKWQTSQATLAGIDGTLYLFRIVGAEPGRVPDNVDEVRDRVVADLRMLRGMQRAKDRAVALVEKANELGLEEAWEADAALADLVTPDKGNYYEPPPFSRMSVDYFGNATTLANVAFIGQVDRGFLDTAFELAQAGEDSGVAVAELPDLAKVVVLKGKKLTPLYQERYLAQRSRLLRQLQIQKARELMRTWLNAKQIRERCGFQFARDEA